MGTDGQIGGLGYLLLTRLPALAFRLDLPTGLDRRRAERRLSFARLLRVREAGSAGLLLLGSALAGSIWFP